MMLTQKDKELLEKKGISEEKLAEELACFEHGFPFLKLYAAASVSNGIMDLSPVNVDAYLKAWDIYTSSSVYDGYFGSAETLGGTRYVHGNVSASDNSNGLVLEVRHCIIAYASQHLNCRDDALGKFAGDAQILGIMRTDRDVGCIIVVPEVLHGFLCGNVIVQFDFDARRKNRVDIPLQSFSWKSVAGDAVSEHSAELRTLLEDGGLVSHDSKIVCGGES